MATSHQTRAYFIIALTLVAVVLSTRVGGAFGFPPTNISTFWPPNAILLAALLMMARPHRVICLLLAYPAYVLAELWIDFSIGESLIFALANCLEVGVALLLILRFTEPPFDLGRLRQLLVIFAAVVAAAPIGGLIGAGGVAAFGGPFGDVFVRWSLADLVGFFVFTPLVLTLPAWRTWLLSASGTIKIEAILTAAALLALSLAVYGPKVLWGTEHQGIQFLPIPLLLWIAVRFGPMGAALASVVVSITALTYAIQGSGPFSYLAPEDNVESLQLFITSLVIAAGAVAALTRERDLALVDLAHSHDDLESRVAERSRELGESEQRFRIYFDLGLVGMATTSLEKGWVQFNDHLCEIFGYSRDEMATLSWAEITHPDDLAPDLAHFESVLAGETDGYSMDKRFIHKNGNIIHASISVKCIRRADGEVDYFVAFVSDISERKNLEAQLMRAQRIEAVGQLTGGIAHDFNNMLAVMLGNLELLEDKIRQIPDAMINVEAMKATTHRAAALTQRLLAFSRQQTLLPKATDIDSLLHGLEDMLGRTLGEPINLELKAADGLWPAMIDASQLDQALVNLAINARDAMSHGGNLTIEAANATLDDTFAGPRDDLTPGDYVEICVSDTGLGIAPDVLEKVFEPFFTTKDVGKGSGLGLSMVYGFVKQSGGHITIYSEPGQGTSVKLYLPRSRDQTSPREAPSETPRFEPGSGRILVVEDDEKVRAIPVYILRHQGYHVVEASDGDEACALLDSEPPFDLLFTDIVLPGGMTGVDIATRATDSQPGIKILYTTGYAEGVADQGGQLKDGAEVLNKPYRRVDLLEKVGALMDKM
jgi:PAS domain S-box-containing protein